MKVEDFYLKEGEINLALLIEKIKDEKDIPVSGEMLNKIINHESVKRSEKMYAKGWDACFSFNKRMKRFSIRTIKDYVLEDDNAVIPLKEFIRWFASVKRELLHLNLKVKSDCCKGIIEAIDDKVDTSLGKVRTDRRLLFSKEEPIFNVEFDPSREDVDYDED